MLSANVIPLVVSLKNKRKTSPKIICNGRVVTGIRFSWSEVFQSLNLTGVIENISIGYGCRS